MKKILLFMMAVVMTITSMADNKEYTERLTISMNGSVSSQDGEITIESLANGNINITLKNFIYESSNLPVGNITLSNIALEDVTGKYAGQFKKFTTSQSVVVTAGDKVGVDTWYGPYLGALPVEATGQVSDDKIYVSLAIDVTAYYGAVLYVEVGEPLNAAYYSDNLIVTVNDVSSDPIPATVTVATLENGNINFLLKNFSLNEDMHVGNIEVNGLELTDGDGYNTFQYVGEINITPGDIEDVDEDSYIGPLISPIPIDLNGKITEDKLYVTIDIDMREQLSQIIYVIFGTDITNGISSLSVDKSGKGSIYDFLGRRVNKAEKGLYIINGRKVVR